MPSDEVMLLTDILEEMKKTNSILKAMKQQEKDYWEIWKQAKSQEQS